jgi:hypothetical protein
VVSTAREVGVDCLVFEHDDPGTPAVSVERATSWLGLDASGSR